jgi:hypothetical protein
MPNFDFDAFNHDEIDEEAPSSSSTQQNIEAPKTETDFSSGPSGTDEVDKW